MYCRTLFLTLLFFGSFYGCVLADDCGVRGYDGDEILKLDCEVPSTAMPSSLQVTTPDGTIHSLSLVDEDAPNATKFRVRYTDYSTGSAVEVINAIGKILPGISSCEELQMIGYHPDYPLDGSYQLATDIDCKATSFANWSNPKYEGQLWEVGYVARFGSNGFDGVSGVNPATGHNDDFISELSLNNLGSKGFKPIGALSYPQDFSGVFDGNKKSILNLTISRPGENDIGLFLATNGAQIKNVKLLEGSISGRMEVGALVGVFYRSNMTNVYSFSAINGMQTVGGLAGRIDTAVLTDCKAAGTVTGNYFVGGLSGYMNISEITGSYAAVDVQALGGVTYVYAGGIVGASFNSSDKISNSYTTGIVNGNGRYVGGLIGANAGIIINSYAGGSGSVTGVATVGGLVGAHCSGVIINSYTTKNVNGSGQYIGGVVGHSNHSDNIINNAWIVQSGISAVGYALPSYTTSAGRPFLGNPIPSWGIDESNVSAFYYADHPVYQNSAVSPEPSNAWDFENVWVTVSGELPHLKWQDGLSS